MYSSSSFSVLSFGFRGAAHKFSMGFPSLLPDAFFINAPNPAGDLLGEADPLAEGVLLPGFVCVRSPGADEAAVFISLPKDEVGPLSLKLGLYLAHLTLTLNLSIN